MKKIAMTCLAVLLLAGCTGANTEDVPSATAEAEPTVAPTQETVSSENLMDKYPDLPEENHFVVADQTQILNMLQHGSGIVLLGFPDCPFCQAYVPIVEEVVANYDVPVLYYDIQQDRADNTEFYQQVVEILDGQLDYDNDGNPRVYVPDITFTVKGEIIGHDNESSMVNSKETTPQEYWSDDKLLALKDRLTDWTILVWEARTEGDNTGCDTGCVVQPRQ